MQVVAGHQERLSNINIIVHTAPYATSQKQRLNNSQVQPSHIETVF